MRQTGRITHGLTHALAVWLAAFAGMYFARNLATAWAILGAGLLGVLLLGSLHRRHHRADSAVGAYTGAVLWPLLFGAAIIAVNIVSMSLSPYE